MNENYYWEKKAENFIKTGSYYGYDEDIDEDRDMRKKKI